MEDNLAHMQTRHSFFVAAQEFCTDLQGLFKYLGEKVNKGLLCLYCENAGTKGFHSREALQDHMTAKGHCFMLAESFDEYKRFYDFSSQFQELEAYCAQF